MEASMATLRPNWFLISPSLMASGQWSRRTCLSCQTLSCDRALLYAHLEQILDTHRGDSFGRLLDVSHPLKGEDCKES